MRIEVFLKKNEGGCEFSKDFEREFINNDKLHPLVKEIEVEWDWYDNIPEPEIIVYNDIDDAVYVQKGNQVLASHLQKYILNYYG